MPGSATSPNAPRRVRGLLLQQECLRLRTAGKSFGVIAEACGVSKSTVGDNIKKALARVRKENDHTMEAIRDLELENLRSLQNALWEKAMAGDVPSVGECLKISARRSMLIGLDAPKQAEITHNKSQPFMSLAEKEAAVRERIATIIVVQQERENREREKAGSAQLSLSAPAEPAAAEVLTDG